MMIILCSLGLINKLLLRDDDDLDHFMNTLVKETLEIPEEVTWGGQSNDVFSSLYEDFMKPATKVGMYRLEQLEAFTQMTVERVVLQRVGHCNVKCPDCMLPEE
jgi:hypothetical protein